MALKRSIDTPTNTFATLNPLTTNGTTTTPITLSNGNLRTTHSHTGQWQGVRGTMSVSSGMWYFEVAIIQVPTGSTQNYNIGFYKADKNNGLYYREPGNLTFGANGGDPEIFIEEGTASYGSLGGNESIYMFCLDVDNEKFWVGLNGNWFANGDPSTGANPSASGFGKANWTTVQSDYTYSGAGSFQHNYGQDPTFSGQHTKSRIHTDASGYGEFAYEPPAGAMALCTANITPANVTSAPYVVDETGNHSISVAGTKNVEISSSSPYITEYSNSLYFDGSNGSDAQHIGGNFSPTNNDYSIECYVKFNENGWAKQPAFFQTVNADHDPKNKEFWFGYMNGALVVSKHGDGNFLVECSWTPEANRWYHIKAERKFEVSLNFYIDGVQLNNFEDGSKRDAHKDLTFADSSGLSIGARDDGAVIDGYISGLKWQVGEEVQWSQYEPIPSSMGLKGSAKISIENPGLSGSPNVRHTEMKSRASQNFKGGSFAIDRAAGLTIKGSETTTFGTGDYTIECWVYVDVDDITDQDYWTICDFRQTGSDTNSFVFGVRGSNGGLYSHSGSSIVHTNTKLFSQEIKNKTWHHVVLVRENDNINCFLDGATGISDAFSNDLSATNDLTIGWSYHAPTSYRLVGKIADLRITKGEAKYGGAGNDVASFTPPTEPLQLEEGKDQILLQPWKQAITLGGYKQADESQEGVGDYFRAITWDSGKPNGYEYHVGFRPDFFWAQQYNADGAHWWVDSVRGAASGLCSGNTNAASGSVTEGSYSGYNGYNGFEDFTDNGFMVNDHAGGGEINYTTNDSRSYVGFLIRAGGKPSADGKAKIDGVEQDCSELMTGDLTLQPTKLSAGTKSGFSIVRFTSSGGKIPHGLGKAPNVIIFKGIDGGGGWWMYHSSVNDPANNGVPFHNTSAALGSGGNFGGIADELGFYLESSQSVVPGNQDTIAYCWASIPGFSSFGIYHGNGNADGPFVNCGFRPKFVYLRSTGGQREGLIWDSSGRANSGSGIGPSDAMRVVSNTLPYDSVYADQIQFTNDGFKMPSAATPNTNGSTESYIYMAFADSSTFGELGTKSKKNPMIVNPKQGFKAVTWVGQSQSDWDGTIGTVECGFKPDLVWWKNRDYGHDHGISDSVRGPNFRLYPTYPNSDISSPDTIQSFEPNGFKIGSENGINNPAYNYIGWAWKAGGSGADFMKNGEEDTSIATGGSITPDKMSVGTETGFSIVKYPGGSDVNTIPHGLNSAPEMIIIKNLDNANGWVVGSSYLSSWAKGLGLDISNGEFDATSSFNSTAPDNNVFTLGNSSGANNSSYNYIAYCWHSVPGYSAFGSYEANGSTDGPFTYTGFKPAFVMIKRTDVGNGWEIHDNARDPHNPSGEYLMANETSYSFSSPSKLDLLSNGFKIRTNGNSTNTPDGGSYIYMAFAERSM